MAFTLSQPLSKSQQALRGRKIADMTDAQLVEWIDACQKMEAWPRIEAKGRRGWKDSRLAAELEIERRATKLSKLMGQSK
jgi:hypothetical protein